MPTKAQYDSWTPSQKRYYVETGQDVMPETLSAHKPALAERVKLALTKPKALESHKVPLERNANILQTLVGFAARNAGAYASGRGLYIPDIFVRDLLNARAQGVMNTEQFIDKFTGFTPTPQEEMMGTGVKVLGGYQGAGKLLQKFGIKGTPKLVGRGALRAGTGYAAGQAGIVGLLEYLVGKDKMKKFIDKRILPTPNK